MPICFIVLLQLNGGQIAVNLSLTDPPQIEAYGRSPAPWCYVSFEALILLSFSSLVEFTLTDCDFSLFLSHPTSGSGYPNRSFTISCACVGVFPSKLVSQPRILLTSSAFVRGGCVGLRCDRCGKLFVYQGEKSTSGRRITQTLEFESIIVIKKEHPSTCNKAQDLQ